jgi:N-acetylmuramoyl-L-alanine amidase
LLKSPVIRAKSKYYANKFANRILRGCSFKMLKRILKWADVAACAALLIAAAIFVSDRQETVYREEPDFNRPLILLDAGHGGFDAGAKSKNGVEEDDLNLTVAKLVQEGLTKAGCDVVMTRETKEALGKTKRKDMEKRADLLSRDDISLVVSIHMNKFKDASVSGPMAYYMKGSDPGQKLAEFVINEICDSIGRPRRFANPGDYFIIRETSSPAVLVECGFLSNPDDEVLLQDPAHQQKLADGIVKGVTGYLKYVEWDG